MRLIDVAGTATAATYSRSGGTPDWNTHHSKWAAAVGDANSWTSQVPFRPRAALVEYQRVRRFSQSG